MFAMETRCIINTEPLVISEKREREREREGGERDNKIGIPLSRTSTLDMFSACWLGSLKEMTF